MQISIRTPDNLRTAVVFLTCLSGGLCGAAEQAPNSRTATKSIQAVRTETPPKIDGILDDAVWQQAAIVQDLHEVSPNEFEEASQHSTFMVL